MRDDDPAGQMFGTGSGSIRDRREARHIGSNGAGRLAINRVAVGAQACCEFMTTLGVGRARLCPGRAQRNKQAPCRQGNGPRALFLTRSSSRSCPASGLEVDVAKLNHMRTGLHEPAADDGEIIGRAQLDAQNQMTSLEMAFQLFCLVGS